MQNEPINVTVMSEDTTEKIAVVVRETGVEAATADGLRSSFAPFFANARTTLAQSKEIVVTDISQTLQMKLARECRLAFRKIRVDADKLRKTLKEDSLRRGKAIDGFYNILLAMIGDEENRLDQQEKFAEAVEKQRIDKLRDERAKILAQYGVDTAFMSLGEMPDSVFAQLVDNSRMAHDRRIEEQRKQEEDRIKSENARLAEEKRIREENDRLREEAEIREAQAKAERERLEAERKAEEAAARKEAERVKAEHEAALAEERRRAKEEADRVAAIALSERKAAEAKAEEEKTKAHAIAAKEREAREKIERELAAQRAEEDRIRKQEEAAKRAAAKAPDKKKIEALRDAVSTITVPNFSTIAGRSFAGEFVQERAKFVAWLQQWIEQF